MTMPDLIAPESSRKRKHSMNSKLGDDDNNLNNEKNSGDDGDVEYVKDNNKNNNNNLIRTNSTDNVAIMLTSKKKNSKGKIIELPSAQQQRQNEVTTQQQRKKQSKSLATSAPPVSSLEQQLRLQLVQLQQHQHPEPTPVGELQAPPPTAGEAVETKPKKEPRSSYYDRVIVTERDAVDELIQIEIRRELKLAQKAQSKLLQMYYDTATKEGCENDPQK